MAKQPAKKPAAKKPARTTAKPATKKAKAGARATPAKNSTPKKPPAKKPTKPAPRTAVAKAPATRTPAGPKVKGLAPAALAVPPARSRFTLFDLLGQPRAYYLVERVELPSTAVDPKNKPLAHAVAVIDRSGSMYPHMRDIRDALLRLFSQPEFRKQPLVISLVSYSGAGDAEVPIRRLPVAEVMQEGGDPQRQIKRMDVTALTSVSTGLKAADELVRPGEPTSITLHADGYSNDPSPAAEAAALQTVVGRLREKDVVVNTVAFSDAADYRQLLGIANGLNGRCVKAEGIDAVYEALYAGLAALGTPTEPPTDVPLPPGCEFQVYVSRAAGRVNAAAGPLRVVGRKPGHDAAVYQYRRVDEGEYRAMSDAAELQGSEAVYAFARGQLAAGKLNTAKYALASTFDATLVDAHVRALTNPQIAALAGDLDRLIAHPEELRLHQRLSAVPVNPRTPLLEVVRLLEGHPDDYRLDLADLKAVYPRRTVERVRGGRDAAGNVVEPWLRTEFVETDDHVRVSGWDLSRNTATLNLTVGRRVRLVKVKGSEPITTVAGRPLDDLRQFESYTVVGDGELNVPRLKVRVTGRGLFDALRAAGVLETPDGSPAGRFDPKADLLVRFDRLPLVPPFAGPVRLDGLFDELAGLRVLGGVVTAHLKDASAEFTPEQVEELKKHYLSKTLHLNFPTTTPYTDRLDALSKGTLDTRTSYRIDLGNRQVLNLGKLPPANKFLERMYEVRAGGKPVDKPRFEDAPDGQWTYAVKHLSSRVRVTRADELMRDYVDEFLGLKATGKAVGVLDAVGADALAKIVRERLMGKPPDRGAFVAALTDARGKIDARQDELFRERLAPLVFYVGSTGLLPEELDATPQTADQIAARYPDLGLSKDEREGTFFEVGDGLLTVYAQTEDYTPAK